MRFDWEESRNVKNIEVYWPVPKRKDEMGLQVLGYEGRQIFPVDVEVSEPGKDVHLVLKLDAMVCKDICIPQDIKVTLDIPVGEGVEYSSGMQKRLKKAKAKAPDGKDNPVLKIETVVASKDALAVGIVAKKGFDKIDIFAGTDNVFFAQKPALAQDERNPDSAILTLHKSDEIENLRQELQGQELLLLVTDGESAVEKTIEF